MADEKTYRHPEAYAWGQIFGHINKVVKLTPAQINDACMYPLRNFALIMRDHSKKITKSKYIDNKIAELTDQISPDTPMPLSMDAQGEWQLGFYHAKNDLDRTGKTGAPLAENRVDWSKADWSKSDAVLAKEYDVTRQASRAARLRHNQEQKPQ